MTDEWKKIADENPDLSPKEIANRINARIKEELREKTSDEE